MSGGRVVFVGCGPGAADLLTLRAIRALRDADVVIWHAALLERRVLDEHLRDGAEVVQWPPATGADILAIFDRAVTEELLVVRLKGGDPTVFGALEPELSAVAQRGLGCAVVPGVSAFAAGAAALGLEVARPSAPLLLVEAADLDASPGPPWAFAVHAPNRDPRRLQQALLDRGLADSAPCVVVIEVSRTEQTAVPCSLGELAETIEDFGLGVLTLVLAGP